VLAHSDEDDRTLSGSHSRESTSSLRVTIKLGDDDTSNWNGLLEGHGLILASLTNGRVHDEDNIIWFDGLLHLLHLIEEIILLLVSTRGIHNDHLEALLLKLVHTLNCNLNWVSLSVGPKEWDPHLRSILLQLVKCTCSEGISTDQTCPEPLLLPIVSILRA
jgi:hypothetical protein